MRKEGLQVRDGRQVKQVSIDIIPFQDRGLEERYFLVLFQQLPLTAILQPTEKSESQQKTNE